MSVIISSIIVNKLKIEICLIAILNNLIRLIRELLIYSLVHKKNVLAVCCIVVFYD